MGRMQPTPKTPGTVLDLMLNSVSQCFDRASAGRLVESQIDPVVQKRIDVLAEKANEGLLTEQELAEYEAYINADDFIAILKLKARQYLATAGVD